MFEKSIIKKMRKKEDKNNDNIINFNTCENITYVIFSGIFDTSLAHTKNYIKYNTSLEI